MKFKLKQNLLILTMLACIGGLIGCTPASKSVANSETNKTVVNSEKTTGEKTDKNSTSPTNRDTTTDTKASSDDKIGVPECDEYIEKYEACITGKVPEAARQQLKDSFEQTRKTWKNLAANPQTKSSLASACKQSQDAAKAAMSAYSCEW